MTDPVWSAEAYDVVVLGAGAAGLMCAMEAGRRGRRVLLLDHAAKPGEKIRISGGGRCNFTNLHASPRQYLSRNTRFCASALARYTQRDFIALVEKHGIAYHEKTLGQLFCDGSSTQIVSMLVEECRAAGVQMRLGHKVGEVRRPDARFRLSSDSGEIACASLVVACGGLSIPKMGASGFGYALAQQFGHALVPTEAALVPFTLDAEQLHRWGSLSGLAVEANVRCGAHAFREGMLFTHRGLSGPSMLQISSYWETGKTLQVNLLPERDAAACLAAARGSSPKQEVVTALGGLLPRRLAETVLGSVPGLPVKLADLSNRGVAQLAQAVHGWQVRPAGTEGYRTAEVTRGGVDTAGLSSKTMESTSVPGLFFIGEVVDVTGHLGGFNFQWAWSSGHAAGQHA